MQRVWGTSRSPEDVAHREYGSGHVVCGGELRCGQATQPRQHPITRAQWIWFPEGSPASSAPPGQRRFLHQFELEADKRVAAAELEMTADNGFQVWINNQLALQGDNFHVVYRADVATMLCAGRNTIRVIATNGADRDNPAGLIGALEIRFADGSQHDVLTDRTWRADRVVESSGVQTDDALHEQMASAQELGAYDMAPWMLNPVGAETPPLYPPYDATARLLTAAGVPPDFEADGSIRYTHRMLPDRDVYFVANRTNERVETSCTFRVSDRSPDLWNPLDGTIRPLPDYTRAGGRIQIPLQFEPYQSYFVVFRAPVAATQDGPRAPGIFRSANRWDASRDLGMSCSTRRRAGQGKSRWRSLRIGASTRRPRCGTSPGSPPTGSRSIFRTRRGRVKPSSAWTWGKCTTWHASDSTAATWVSCGAHPGA